MDIEHFDYELPDELIAQTPIDNRTDSRLLLLDPANGNMRHSTFANIGSFLKKGDCLVLNDTRVLPARLCGMKKETGATIEVLLLKPLHDDTWEVLAKPAKRVKEGTKVTFGAGELTATCVSLNDDGRRNMQFTYDGNFYEMLDRIGDMPLPPYIHKSLEDRERYQTVYARHTGSAAAPTAGLHFTKELLDHLRELGVQTVFLTLHVGLGTFRPVTAARVENHKMHGEYYRLTKETADELNRVRSAGGRIIAVGTTAVRTLETVASRYGGSFRHSSGWTEIFIYPGYRFQGIDGMITNFHLPKSTLLMLVSAFAGRDHILRAYEEAIKERYRFFSFGDAMLILEEN